MELEFIRTKRVHHRTVANVALNLSSLPFRAAGVCFSFFLCVCVSLSLSEMVYYLFIYFVSVEFLRLTFFSSFFSRPSLCLVIRLVLAYAVSRVDLRNKTAMSPCSPSRDSQLVQVFVLSTRHAIETESKTREAVCCNSGSHTCLGFLRFVSTVLKTSFHETSRLMMLI